MENSAMKWGVYYGIAGIASFLVFYLVNPAMIFSINGYLGFVLMILFPVLACREERTNLGGFASFGQMFKTGFITLIVGALIGLIFQYIFMNFIDSGMIDIQREISIEALEKLSGFLGEEGMEAAIEEIENSNPSSIGNTGLGAIGVAIIGAIVAAIIGAIMQKKNPADF